MNDSSVPEEVADAPANPPHRFTGSVEKIAFVCADAPEARAACDKLSKRYNNVPEADADVIVALGGDGFMLETLHHDFDRQIPVYGMNRGSVGFLMNDYDETDLPERIANSLQVKLHPLRMRATDMDGHHEEALAVNEVSLLRQERQAAKVRITIDKTVRMEELICDGILVSTPAGSTAYNLSAHGPIIPLDANVLAMTPISAFRPRRWRGALLPHRAVIRLDVLEAKKRPVSATADFTEIRRVQSVEIAEDRSISLNLLFDPGHSLEERILKEQFTP